MPESRVRHVLFYAATHPGNLMLAEMDNDTLCILRDDAPLEGYRWKRDQLVKAVEAFQKLKSEIASSN